MSENNIEIIRWVANHLEVIDQRIFPSECQYIS
jgi:methylthioribose-1-phosphate isomerase